MVTNPDSISASKHVNRGGGEGDIMKWQSMLQLMGRTHGIETCHCSFLDVPAVLPGPGRIFQLVSHQKSPTDNKTRQIRKEHTQ